MKQGSSLGLFLKTHGTFRDLHGNGPKHPKKIASQYGPNISIFLKNRKDKSNKNKVKSNERGSKW